MDQGAEVGPIRQPRIYFYELILPIRVSVAVIISELPFLDFYFDDLGHINRKRGHQIIV